MKDKIKQYVKTSIIVTMAVLGVTSCNNQNNTSFDTSKRITVVTRDDGSGTKSAFMEIIGLKGKKDPAGVISASSTTTVLATVKTNPLAIAYESLGYVTDEVKILKVNQVDCNVENIKTGDYKIARSLNIVYKETILQNPVFEDFYKFLGSSDSQKIISDNGYVSTKDDTSSYVKENDFKGTINISGSTSLQPLMTLLAEKYETIQTNVDVIVSGGGSGTGYKNAENNVSDFGMISETFNSEKAPSCTSYEVAKDGIALIVNKVNSFDNITLEHLKNIYDCDINGEEKISTWGDLA